MIPSDLIWKLKPLDTSINKVFQENLRNKYVKYRDRHIKLHFFIKNYAFWQKNILIKIMVKFKNHIGSNNLYSYFKSNYWNS